MSATQRISLSKETSLQPQEVHLLPCHINYSGPAPVKEHFKPTSVNDINDSEAELNKEHDSRVAYYRGRKLLGIATTLPEGYIGTIYTPSRAETVSTTALNGHQAHQDARTRHQDVESDDEDEEMEELSTWTPKTTFHTMVEYGNNALPETRLADWIALASAIHSRPVTQ